jgi:hypothetical protein
MSEGGAINKMDKLNSETKTLVIVNDINNTRKLKEYLKTNQKYTVIALTTEAQKKIGKEDIYCKTPSDYLTHKALEEVEQNARLWTKTWPKTKIEGKSFLELVTYSNISLWWFIRDIIYNSVKTSITNIELVKHIVDKEKTKKILFFGNTPFEEILHIFEGVEIKKITEKQLNMKLNLKLFVKKHPTLIWNFSRIYDLLKSIVSKIIVNKNYSSIHEFKRTILICTHNLDWRTVYDPITKQSRTFDSFFDSIIKKLEENDYKIVTTFPLGYLTNHPWSSFISGLKATIGRRKHGMLHKPFEYYLTTNIDIKANVQREALLKIWNKLKNDKRFKKSLKYKDVDLWPLLKTDFLFFFSFVAGHAVRNIEMASRVIDVEKPNLFLTGGGGDQFCDLSIIKKIAQNNIQILEFQHGIITHDMIPYMHPKNEKLYKIAVYGPYFKNLLTHVNKFSPDSVVVTGQPRYDILAKADEMSSRERIFKELNLSFDKKLVVWMTQTHEHDLSLCENKKNISAVYNAMKQLKNIQLVIKLHPNENKKAPLYRKDKSFKPIIVGRDFNTYELLNACDLVITKYSTTGMEAVALNKPLIVLNLGGEPDRAEYVKEGVALGVYDEKDLKPTIEKLLKDASELAKNREKFIEKYFYKIDGKATERVVDLIGEMIKERRENEL